MNFLTLDIGTTCCKCQVFSEEGDILFYRTEEYPLLRRDGEVYVDAEGIRQRVFSLMRMAASNLSFVSVAISSFGEAFVLMDKEDTVLFPPMLYTDPRGQAEAQRLADEIGIDEYCARTGVTPHPMFSISKLMYIKNYYPDIYARADKALLICDFVGYLLTGRRIIDYSLASRTGAFDIRRKVYDDAVLTVAGIDKALFSSPMPAGSTVGEVLPEVLADIGLSAPCTVILGAHDQVATAIGAGVLCEGQAVDGMGTVECITPLFKQAPSDPAFGRMGFPTVPFSDELFCTYICNYSSGSLINWLRKDILHEYRGDADGFFAYMEERLPDKTEVLCLPYFAGNVVPYQDLDARGAFVGLSLSVTDGELYRSVLEGTSLEMRLDLDMASKYGIHITEAVATGGGANSRDWLRIKADITRLTLSTLRSSEGGLCGCAMLQAVAMGVCRDLHEAKERFVCYREHFVPADEDIYAEKYRRYVRLYPTLKALEQP